jgi:hypothetical protein
MVNVFATSLRSRVWSGASLPRSEAWERMLRTSLGAGRVKAGAPVPVAVARLKHGSAKTCRTSSYLDTSHARSPLGSITRMTGSLAHRSVNSGGGPHGTSAVKGKDRSACSMVIAGLPSYKETKGTNRPLLVTLS